MTTEFTLHFYGDSVKQEILNRIETGLKSAGQHLQSQLIEKVSGIGTGITYHLPGIGSHTASVPGAPPALMLGHLKSSIVMDFKKVNGELTVIIGVSGVPYAKRLELGFVGVDKLGRRYHQAPRPFFKKSYEEERFRLIQLVKDKL